MGDETVEQAIGECPRIHHPITHISKPYLIATIPLMPWSCGSCGRQTLTSLRFHSWGSSPNPSVQLLSQQRHQHQPDLEDVTCKGCWARSLDLEQSSTANNRTDSLSSDPPPLFYPATQILPDKTDQPLKDFELWELWKAKICSSMDFTTGSIHLCRRCSCLLSNNSSSC